MPRKQGKAVPEGNGPVLRHDELGSLKPTMADLCQLFEERFNTMDKNLDRLSELAGMVRATKKRLVGLEHEARQSRLATEADVESDTKTCKRTEDVEADRAKHGDKSSFARVDHDPMRLTSFGDDSTELPAPEKIVGDTLVDESVQAPKPCLSLKHEARQPHLATEADVELGTKARKRMEDVSENRMKHGNKGFSARVDHDPIHLTSFGDYSTEPPAPEKSIDDAPVDGGAERPKQCLPPVEMRMSAAAGGLLPPGAASTAMRTIFPRSLFLGASVKRPREKPAWQTSTSLSLPAGGRLFKRHQDKY